MRLHVIMIMDQSGDPNVQPNGRVHAVGIHCNLPKNNIPEIPMQHRFTIHMHTPYEDHAQKDTMYLKISPLLASHITMSMLQNTGFGRGMKNAECIEPKA